MKYLKNIRSLLAARIVVCRDWLDSVFPWRIVQINALGVIDIPDGHPARRELAELRGENNRLRAKLRERLKHLRADNKGAECNAIVSQLLAARMALRTQTDRFLSNDQDQRRSGESHSAPSGGQL